MSIKLASLNKLKTFLRIPASETSLDTLLTGYLESVSSDCERYCGRTFARTAYTDESYNVEGTVFALRAFPVDTAVAVVLKEKRVVVIGVPATNTIPASDYTVQAINGVIRLLGGRRFEVDTEVLVTYTAGYLENIAAGTAQVLVPEGLDAAVVRLAAARYKHQQGVITDLELELADKNSLRSWTTYGR